MNKIPYDSLSEKEKVKRNRKFFDGEAKTQINMINNLTLEKKIGNLISYITINADYISHGELKEHTKEMADTIISLVNILEKDLMDMDVMEDAWDGLEIIDEEYFTNYKPWFKNINRVAKENNLPVITGNECEVY